MGETWKVTTCANQDNRLLFPGSTCAALVYAPAEIETEKEPRHLLICIYMYMHQNIIVVTKEKSEICFVVGAPPGCWREGLLT